MKKIEIKYTKSNINTMFQKLISNWDELSEYYNKEVKDFNDGLDYIDIGDIASFIVKKKKSGETEMFKVFFENVEEILVYGENYIKEIIVIGLFESIQNIGGAEIDYYKSFDKWLKNESLKSWRELIDFWENDNWKKSKESEKIMNKNK